MACLKLHTQNQHYSPLRVAYRNEQLKEKTVQRFISVDPLADFAPGLTPYRYGFNNPVLFMDMDGLFETKDAAENYAEENGIKTGFLRNHKIVENDDGTFSIDNKRDGTSTQDHGGDIGILTGALVSANDVVEENTVDKGFFGGLDIVGTQRDGGERSLVAAGTPPGFGPGGVKSIKSFVDIIKGLKTVSTKQGSKAISKGGLDKVRKIYKSLRDNGFKLTKRGNGERVLNNSKTGETIRFTKSKSGGSNKFDSIRQSSGKGKNTTVQFKD